MIDDVLLEIDDRMEKTITSLRADLLGIRTGRATTALVDRIHGAGIQVGVHAIGDKAVHWVLNAVERAQQAHGVKGLRHRVEHGTVMLTEDTARFELLNAFS